MESLRRIFRTTRVEWFVERGIVVDRATVYRWVQRFLPRFAAAARAHPRPIGDLWRIAETYTRLNGNWAYSDRAIDQQGHAVDADFSQRRNAKAAEAFFRRAIDETGVCPKRVTTDKAKCYPPALRTVLPQAKHWTSTYLNNGLERDHGPGALRAKQRLYPMRGFKRAASADVLARGHALIQHLRNGFSKFTTMVPREVGIMNAWSPLIHAI